MAETTRIRTRNAAVKASTPSDDDTTPNTPIDDNSNAAGGRGEYATPWRTDPSAARDDVSRPSQDLDPMNLEHELAVHKPDAYEAGEIDPLGQDVKEVIATMSRLEALGLQRQQISFPRCIILGQQSTGKSSVIEAISGIKTPRDTGTCTCCPLYITMKSSDDPNEGWHARVSLRQYFDLDLQGGSEQQYPGWVPIEQSRDIPFAKTNSPGDLEHLIRCAQSANLSPLEDPTSFLNASGPREGRHKTRFSPNVVCIEISQPGLPTLNFYDLPGIISQAETDAEAYTVPLVQNLVADYIQDPRALILVTCDLSNDIANSTAAGLARLHNATDRCIGVLTKPDRLQAGTPDKALVDVLEGRRFQLGHKYFVVKNLDQEQIKRGLTHRDARIKENEFFASGRWATSLRQYQPRFGTLNLQMYLSKELAKQTLSNLPRIREQIIDRLQKVEIGLKSIPENPTHSAVRVIADILLSFSTKVRNEMEGEHAHTTWRNTWAKLQNAFNDALVTMRPTMSIKGDLDKGIFFRSLTGKTADDAMEVNSDDEDGDGDLRTPDTPETPVKKRRREDATPAPSPFKTPVKPAMKPRTGTATQRPSSAKSGGQNATPYPANFAEFKKKFLLDQVKREVSLNSYSKVPGQIHPKVQDAMMLSALAKWSQPMEVFFNTLEKDLKNHMGLLFNKHFDDWQGTELHIRAWAIIQEMLRNNLKGQKITMAVETLNDEHEGPYIFYQDHFNREKSLVLEKYRQHRLRVRFKVFVEEAVRHYRRELTQSEEDKIRNDEKKMALISEEPYAEEIDLVANITSYYNIAARRLHDSICMRIESKFFKQLRTQLRDELESGLGIYDDNHGPQNAQRLLEKSPERASQRQRLLSEREALLQGLKCLDELRQRYRGGPSANLAHSIGPPSTTPPTEDMEGVTPNGLPHR